jgi:aldose 1-epimerase
MVRFSVLEPWQDPRGGQIERIRLDNGTLALEVLSLGGIIRSLWTPDRHGERGNIVLGCDSAVDYLRQGAHLGAIAGRFANRIAKGLLSHRGIQYRLDTNLGEHCLHGGSEGFNRRLWQLGPLTDGVRLTLRSADGDMGFPGNCTVQLDYRLAGNNLYVELLASVDKACPVSLTQHSYFNLDGSDNLGAHRLQSDAHSYLTQDAQGIPTGIAVTEGSVFDLSCESALQERLTDPALRQTRGFDHCLLMDNRDGGLKRFGCLSSSASGRAMTLYTNQPGVQLYCANFLGGTVGRRQQTLKDHQGVCLEPQLLPDSPNQPNLPGDAWLQPGELYHHISRYQFEAH